MMEKFKKFLVLEAGIEIKACLYFSIILFFYFLYCFLQGSLFASIPRMVEMVLSAYAMNYLQVYLLHNFDEAEQFDIKVTVLSLFCAALYTAAGHWLNWFDRNPVATLCFFFYMILCYVCVFLVHKIKRDLDTAYLNRELEQFKSRRGQSGEKGGHRIE